MQRTFWLTTRQEPAMLIDMIHDNHGEPPVKTRYRDPAVLRSYGYEAIIIPDALAALPSIVRSSGPAVPANYNSVAELEAAVDRRVRQAVSAGMKIFFYGDALLLPRAIVEADVAQFTCQDNIRRLCPARPAVMRAMQQNVLELFERWPEASGLVMRTAEVYPESTPHMVGNALQEPNCPLCRGMGLIERLRQFIRGMFDVTVTQAGKMYIHRAWQRHGRGVSMHDDPEVYREITTALPESDKLCFSFKFTRGDFRQGQPGNPCIAADHRPKWIEFQCEREFEGKGAFPNFQVPFWKEALAGLGDQPNLSFWGWSRGGGWGGPYAQREEWIDANVYGLAELYRNRNISPETAARQWAAHAFGIDAHSRAAGGLAEILLASGTIMRQLAYDHTAAIGDQPWVRDDLIDVEQMWESAARLTDDAAAENACASKLAALTAVETIRQQFDALSSDLPNKSQARDLSNTLVFLNSFAGTVAHMYCGFVRYFQWQRGNKTSRQTADAALEHLEHAQAHWQHNTQRHAMLPGAPSVFQEQTFWERTNTCLEELSAMEGVKS